MVSIVMPVYNTGTYLQESINCILNQTCCDYELICVDDCSKDSLTLKILEEFEQRDARIKVIHLSKNVGAAEARNIGLECAQGEHIIFLDADDLFDFDMLEKMHECLVTNDVDMCVCGHRILSEDSHAIEKECSLKKILGITDRVFNMKELGEEALLLWSTAPWNKMCKKTFIQENNIFFQTLSSSNDVFYSLMCNLSAERIAYCNEGKSLMTYRVGNVNQISANNTPLNFSRAIQYLLDVKEQQLTHEMWIQIMYALIVCEVGELKRSLNDNKRRECYEVIKKFVLENKDRLSFNSRQASCYVKFFAENEFESKWFEVASDFERQYEANEDRMRVDFLLGNKNIVVWGNGMRGKAFQRYCKKRGISNIFVTDKKNNVIGSYTEEGFLILHTERAIERAEVILASNHMIFEEITGHGKPYGIQVIDLEKYCPID